MIFIFSLSQLVSQPQLISIPCPSKTKLYTSVVRLYCLSEWTLLSQLTRNHRFFIQTSTQMVLVESLTLYERSQTRPTFSALHSTFLASKHNDINLWSLNNFSCPKYQTLLQIFLKTPWAIYHNTPFLVPILVLVCFLCFDKDRDQKKLGIKLFLLRHRI